MNIPDSFRDKIIGAFGKEGDNWLHSLNERISLCVDRWKLHIIVPVSNLSYNYVLNAKDTDGNSVILKLGLPGFDFTNEWKTVQAYDGIGCAKVLDADPELGAMLLEQLTPGIMLSEEEDEEVVLQNFVKVWKTLRREVPANFRGPDLWNWMEGLQRYLDTTKNDHRPISELEVRQAYQYFVEVTDSSSKPELLHGDLHHENILFSSEKGWLAIDPKGVIGDSYFDVVSFLINQLEHKEQPKEIVRNRIEYLIEKLSFDKERLLKAAIALATLYACWGVEDNADWETEYQCVRWFREFLEQN